MNPSFPNEIFELIIGFSDAKIISTLRLVCRDFCHIGTKKLFSLNKTNHLLSLWYHLLDHNNKSLKIGPISNIKISRFQKGPLKFESTETHFSIRLFNFSRIFKSFGQGYYDKVRFVTINEFLYIVFDEGLIKTLAHRNRKPRTDVIRVHHSLDFSVKNRVKQLNLPIDCSSQGSIRNCIFSYHYRKNLNHVFGRFNDHFVIVNQNLLVSFVVDDDVLKYWKYDTNDWQIVDENKIWFRDQLPFYNDVHYCEPINRLACVVTPIKPSFTFYPNRAIVFSKPEDEPHVVVIAYVTSFPDWIHFCNDSNKYFTINNELYVRV